MRRHLIRFALISATFTLLAAAPAVPGAAAAEASGYCVYLFRNGSGLTICL